nr:hypothetical protein [uncultured Vibrio sp.]
MTVKKFIFIGGSRDGNVEHVSVHEDQRIIEVCAPEEKPVRLFSKMRQRADLTFQKERYVIHELRTNKTTLNIATLEDLDLLEALAERLIALAELRRNSL